MTSIILNHFANQTREQVESITERDYFNLGIYGQIEYYLITNGYVNHQIANKIEIVSQYYDRVGSISVEILSTKKHCRKPSFCHVFDVNMMTSNPRIELVKTYRL